MEEIDLNDIKRRMENSVEVLKTEFSGLRTGRASANMFETINVNAYGQAMKLRDLATVSIPEAKLVSIQVWDAGNISLIEKGIHESGLNLNPQTEGSIIRIVMPELNEERRQELAKTASKYAENSKISVRNVRQDSMNLLKRLHQANNYTDDEQREMADKIQNLTNEVIKSIETLSLSKEEEIKTTGLEDLLDNNIYIEGVGYVPRSQAGLMSQTTV